MKSTQEDDGWNEIDYNNYGRNRWESVKLLHEIIRLIWCRPKHKDTQKNDNGDIRKNITW